MIERYSDKKIKEIFSRKNRLNIFLSLQKELVIFLSSNASEVSDNFSKVDILKLSKDAFEIEEKIKHEMASFVDALELQLPEYSGVIHRGLTSSDILDTTFSIQLKESIEYTIDQAKNVVENIEKKSKKIGNILITGRTHGQAAEPMYISHMFDNYIEQIERSIEKLEIAKDSLPVKASGPVGNYSNISTGFETTLAIKKDMNQSISTQVISRDFYSEVIHCLCTLSAIYEKIALDIRLHSQTGIEEMNEGFSDLQKGSSAMPHKKNPILCENISGLSRLIRSYIGPAYENIVLWGQRDMSHSSVERVIYEDAFILINFMSRRMSSIIKNLYVNEKNIEKNIENNKKKLVSHSILVDLMEKGMPRSKAYRKVQEYMFSKKEEFKDLTFLNIKNIINLDRFKTKDKND